MEVTKEKNEAIQPQLEEKATTKNRKKSASSIDKKSTNASRSTTKVTKIEKDNVDNSNKSQKKSTSNSTKKVNSSVRKGASDKLKEIKQNETAIPIAEYYDLPYRYNQTIVKILAQTPHSLFIYWDISDEDRSNFIENYGDTFFDETKPILIVHNQTLNTSFEIEVDDFTNSWYLKTPTSNCVFNIELGRKKITNNPKIDFENNSNILHITTSNVLESPNDHILRDLPNTIHFKNIITNQIETKDISSISLKNISSLIELYQDNNEYEQNPSSEFNTFQVV